MIEWYKKVFVDNYANFNGRARRSEYWYFVLGNVILAVIAAVLDNVLGLTIAPLPYGYIYLLLLLATIIPSIAVAVRRLHDVGKSGWFYFIVLIPLVGAIWLLVLFFTEGNRGENEYGPDPKALNDDFSKVIN